jgi:hypothetical protein
VGERIDFPNPCPLSRLPRPYRGASDPAGADDDGGGAARAVRRARDAGADEIVLAPATADPDEIERVEDLLF